MKIKLHEPSSLILRILFLGYLLIYLRFGGIPNGNFLGEMLPHRVPLIAFLLYTILVPVLLCRGAAATVLFPVLFLDLFLAMGFFSLYPYPASIPVFLFPLLTSNFAGLGTTVGTLLISFLFLSLHGLRSIGSPSQLFGSFEFLRAIAFLFFLFLFAVRSGQVEKESNKGRVFLSLIEVGQELGATLNMERIGQTLKVVLESLFSYHTMGFYVLDEMKREAELQTLDSPMKQAFLSFSLDMEGSIFIGVIREGQPAHYGDLRIIHDRLIPDYRFFRSLAVMPIQFEGTMLGFFFLIHPQRDFYTQENLRLMKLVANQVAVAMKNVKLHETIYTMAITDSLTGLYTHGYFQQLLADLVADNKRDKRTFSVLMIDVDYFKIINDTYGHPSGDRVLAQLSGVIKSVLTKKDVVGRYGGDEFVIALPQTDKVNACSVAEKIRKTVEDVPFYAQKGDPVHMTISLGVATFPGDGEASTVIVEAADKCLYQAKQSGRNKIAFKP